MNKKILYITASILTLTACTTGTSGTSSFAGQGQVIYHWERENTGIQKFARDHNECMKNAEALRFIPNFKSWFYSEEAKLDVRANWHSDRGVWASYISHPGAQPVIVNSLRRNEAINPRKYRLCMEDKGYWHRTYNIPSTTNIFTYRPQTVPRDMPFEGLEL